MAAWVDLPTFRSFVGNTNANDTAALQAAIDGGCDKVDELCGPTIAVAVTERVPGGGYELPLEARAESLTSIAKWPYGYALAADDFYVEGQLLFRKDRDWIGDDLTVTYVAGVATAPPWAANAAMLIGQQWFRSRLQPNLGQPGTLTGFLVPNQAMEFMADHLLASL